MDGMGLDGREGMKAIGSRDEGRESTKRTANGQKENGKGGNSGNGWSERVRKKRKGWM